MSVGSVITAPGHAMPEGDSPIRNESIMASAGSGKTYALSSRYLQLVLMGAEPGSILASTFTRLAAGEIRDRILARLAEAAIDESKRDELAKSVGKSTEQTGAAASRRSITQRDRNGGAAGKHSNGLTQAQVLAALSHLTRSLHRLHIRTLDSFFAQVVRCFALELGLDPAAEVIDPELDTDMRREAIEMMLDERDPQPLIDLLRVLTEGASPRGVTDAIDGEMSALYELFREAPPQAWQAIDFWKPLEHDELRDAIARLCGNPPTESGHHINAHKADCERARAARPQHSDDWIGFLCKGLACAIDQKNGVFHRKAVAPEVARNYEPLIDHAKAVIRNAIIGRTLSTRDLLERFHRSYEAVKSKHKALTFADITAKMAEALSPIADSRQPTADDICFRLDATLRHLLLDEMQDTSVQQWRALAEIVRNIISEPPPDRSFFCVGDVKQSIYGWREACPEILAQMPALIEALGGQAGRGAPLIRNWRSSPIVLHTVDRVLIDTASNPAMENCADAAQTWDESYLPHEANFKDKPGYVELRIAPRAHDDDEGQYAVRIAHAADLIAHLYHEAPGRRIGVLTRTNKTVNRFLYELGPAHRNLDVAGRGGGSFTDSAAVNTVLDLLRLADHPDHTVAAFNVIHSPLGEAIGFTNLTQCPRFARDVRRALLDEGYSQTIGRWIALVGSRTDKRQFRRLIQLQQLAARFDARPSLRADDFVDLAESTDAGSFAGGGAARVQVMTVHQAKGLEFDIVVLADLDQDIVNMRNVRMVVERDSCGNIQRIARHMKQDIWSLFDDLEPMFAQQKSRMARESLCLLYVAMTRARSALHMVIDPPAENEKKVRARLSGIVRCALAEEDAVPESIVYKRGDERWFEKEPPAVDFEPEGPPASECIELAPDSGATPRGRAAVAASHTEDELVSPEAGRGLRFAPSLRITDRAARERGTAIHAMFETIEWIENFEADRDRLVRIAMEVAPRRGESWAAEQAEAFLKMIESGPVRTLLSRKSLGETASVRREMRFARLVDGAVQTGVIDRLAAQFDEGGRCERAIVLDYKTDDVDVEGLADRAARYRPQLETYRAAAAAMLGVDESRVEMNLLFVTTGEVAVLT